MFKNRIGYKLLHVRKDNSLGPLFINKKQIIPIGKWLLAEPYKTKGYKFRPGWHICSKPSAPHLKDDCKHQKRAWYKVEFMDANEIIRPESQGGLWYIAKYIKILEKVEKL